MPPQQSSQVLLIFFDESGEIRAEERTIEVVWEGSQNPRPVAESATRTGHPREFKLVERVGQPPSILWREIFHQLVLWSNDGILRKQYVPSTFIKGKDVQKANPPRLLAHRIWDILIAPRDGGVAVNLNDRGWRFRNRNGVRPMGARFVNNRLTAPNFAGKPDRFIVRLEKTLEEVCVTGEKGLAPLTLNLAYGCSVGLLSSSKASTVIR
jgi:hypothetical protein